MDCMVWSVFLYVRVWTHDDLCKTQDEHPIILVWSPTPSNNQYLIYLFLVQFCMFPTTLFIYLVFIDEITIQQSTERLGSLSRWLFVILHFLTHTKQTKIKADLLGNHLFLNKKHSHFDWTY